MQHPRRSAIRLKRTLRASSIQSKKSRTFGVGKQKKQLTLEDEALVYTKLGAGDKAGKSKAVPYALIAECTVASATAWCVHMRDGTRLEFHAKDSAARDVWIKAVEGKVAADKAAQEQRHVVEGVTSRLRRDG